MKDSVEQIGLYLYRIVSHSIAIILWMINKRTIDKVITLVIFLRVALSCYVWHMMQHEYSKLRERERERRISEWNLLPVSSPRALSLVVLPFARNVMQRDIDMSQHGRAMRNGTIKCEKDHYSRDRSSGYKRTINLGDIIKCAHRSRRAKCRCRFSLNYFGPLAHSHGSYRAIVKNTVDYKHTALCTD
jgi:hypothetical protein